MQLPNLQFWREVLLALFLAIISAFAAAVPQFDHFGGISLALIAGMLTKALFWKPNSGSDGLAFAGKTLLRIGIVLLGLRLNFTVLAHSGTQVVVFDLLMVILGITLIMFVLRRDPSKQRKFRLSHCGLYVDRHHRNILGNPVAEYRWSSSREVWNFGRSNLA